MNKEPKKQERKRIQHFVPLADYMEAKEVRPDSFGNTTQISALIALMVDVLYQDLRDAKNSGSTDFVISSHKFEKGISTQKIDCYVPVDTFKKIQILAESQKNVKPTGVIIEVLRKVSAIGQK